MKHVLVTGANGFIGKNLCVALRRTANVDLLTFDVDNAESSLVDYLQRCDLIYHLAGVNRPDAIEDFEKVNSGLTETIVRHLREMRRSPYMVMASSIQAALDNPYGISKRKAEDALERYCDDGKGGVTIYRLPNVFGKWCRPNYNSVVATFCHSIAKGLDITITDAQKELELVYIDDVVSQFLSHLHGDTVAGLSRSEVTPVHKVTLGELAERIYSLKNIRTTLKIPELSDPLTRKLHATLLSYFEINQLDYPLQQRTDNRGTLAELLKSDGFGQIFVSRTKPGVVRGNHYHDSKVEKFCVIEGEAIIRFRHIITNVTAQYRVCGEEFRVVDIAPGYTHSIENVGGGDMITLFWANEVFDASKPDTYAMAVSK